MPRTFPPRSALVLVACAGCAAAWRAASAQDLGPSVELRPGQEVTFPVTIANGEVTPGKARGLKPGAAPVDGEITVRLIKHGLSPYAELMAREKTSEPVDFMATGLIGDIKIDEIRVCGQVDAPTSARIASGSWRVSLNRLTIGGKAGLGCP